MFTALSPYHGCMCVIPGDCSIYDYGTVLLTWVYLYQGKKKSSLALIREFLCLQHIMSILISDYFSVLPISLADPNLPSFCRRDVSRTRPLPLSQCTLSPQMERCFHGHSSGCLKACILSAMTSP